MTRLASILAGIAAAIFLALAAQAQHAHQHAAPSAPVCDQPRLDCATAATPLLAEDGRLWLIWVAAGRVSVARSEDRGRSFAAPVTLNPTAATLDTGPDARPKLVIDDKGRLFAAYAAFKDQRYNGQVFITRSDDGGASFQPPRLLTSDPASQRFESLAVDPTGAVFAAWIDKRTAAAARRAGAPYAGAALAFAWLGQDGVNFEAARIAQEQTCECCRIGVAFAGPGKPVVLFRNAFGGKVRDHAVIAFAGRGTPGPVQRVSEDGWETDSCPHHGPSLAIAPDGGMHVAWFTDGRTRQGLYYARTTDGGATFSAPMPIGNPERQPARPALLAAHGGVWLAWKEFDGERTTVLAMRSEDGGVTWSAPTPVAQTADASDHPLLVSDRQDVYLSWLTHTDGYRLIGLGAASAKGKS